MDALGERCCLLTNAQLYTADAAAVRAGVPGIVLMENAGAAVARAILERYVPCRVTVMAGPGNNGGDGFVIARHLQAAGWPVTLALHGDRAQLPEDAAHHAALWTGAVEALSSESLRDSDLLIDALFGAGLSRPLEGQAAEAARTAKAQRIPVIAVDVPSGVSGNDGGIVGDLAFQATLTVTFFRKKPAHLLLPGRDLCGEVLLADIGIPEDLLQEIAPRLWENRPELWHQSFPRRGAAGHKYDHGHVLILGGARMTGAGRLASRAALRSGAGLVTVAAPAAALLAYQLESPSLLTLGCDSEEDWREILADRRKNAVLLGPGNGVGAETQARVLAALASGAAAVLDADALTSFAGEGQRLFAAIKGACVLTPHDGEFARLFPDLKGNKLERAAAAARSSGAVVLLKGSDSVIAAPDGRMAINGNAPPWLATAGAGDVLAGMIAAYLAQGAAPFEATAMAVWLHGDAARRFGPGLISEDLPEILPQAQTALLEDLAALKRTAIRLNNQIDTNPF